MHEAAKSQQLNNNGSANRFGGEIRMLSIDEGNKTVKKFSGPIYCLKDIKYRIR